ncbi:hypothetical protein D3C77_364240 [compost metagenome]
MMEAHEHCMSPLCPFKQRNTERHLIQSEFLRFIRLNCFRNELSLLRLILMGIIQKANGRAMPLQYNLNRLADFFPSEHYTQRLISLYYMQPRLFEQSSFDFPNNFQLNQFYILRSIRIL